MDAYEKKWKNDILKKSQKNGESEAGYDKKNHLK